MLTSVAEVLADKLRTMPFLSKVGGIARAQKLKVGAVTKTLPAYPDPTKKAGYYWLYPESSETGIAYFENLGNEKSGEIAAGRGYQYRAQVRLIVWINSKRLSPPDLGAIQSACVGALQGKHSSPFPGIISILVEPNKEAIQSAELFSKYTYDESESQFLMLPYEYFGFDFYVTYVLMNGCPIPNIVKTDEQC